MNIQTKLTSYEFIKSNNKALKIGFIGLGKLGRDVSEVFGEFFDKSPGERAALGERTRKNFEKYYQWNLSGAQWESYFDSTDVIPVDQSWASQPKIHQPKAKPEGIDRIAYGDQAKWLIANVLGDASKLNTFFEARMTRDLMYRSATSSTGGIYFNESSAAFAGSAQRQEFNFDIAYDQMRHLCDRNNNWERRRIEVMKKKGIIN